MIDTSLSIASFGEDEAGEIYVVDLGGSVYRIKNPNRPPPPQDNPFTIRSAFVRKRSSRAVLNPITVRSNAKKFDLVVVAAGFSPASEGAMVFVNGVGLDTLYTTDDVGDPIFVARLKRSMLAQAGPLVIEVVRADGTHSNQITLEVVE